MLFCYLLACIPVVAGFLLFMKRKEVNWVEWLVGSLVGFVVTGIFHFIAISNMTSDTETWSGQITKTTHYPEWVQRCTRTVSYKVGKTTCFRTETYYVTHHRNWTADCSVNGEVDINEGLFNVLSNSFGGTQTFEGSKSGFHSGDKNIYIAKKKAPEILYPTTASHSWENRIKAAPSLFSFQKVSDKIKVYDYPTNNWMQSGRVLGTAASKISILEWDKMNSWVGPIKKVNVIIIGFGDQDSKMGHWQEAKWIGGKKNDIVITYGGPEDNPAWCYVFGWSEKFEVKRNLESIILEQKVSNETIPFIEKEIIANYQIKDWSKFDYISIEIPWYYYLILIIIMILIQGGYWTWAMLNNFDKHENIKYLPFGIPYRG